MKAAKKVCREIQGLGIDICGLQEIAKWGALKGYIYSRMVMLTDRESHCGFLVSRHWMPAVRSQVFGGYWAGGYPYTVLSFSRRLWFQVRCLAPARTMTAPWVLRR